jgi:DNA (cytosine-5)-methyltransferase 1
MNGRNNKNAARAAIRKTYTVADLFAGIGAFRLAAESTGRFHTAFSCEINRFAQQTYAANFGPVTAGDILAVDPASLPKLDIVFGGPPCQDFSAMGKRAGLAGKRGSLTAVFGKFLRVQKPLAFGMENVKGLLSSKGGKDFKKVRKQFRKAGYDLFAQVCDAADFGLPQHRERLIVVGLRSDLGATFVFPKGRGRKATFGSVLDKSVPAKYFLSPTYAKTLKERTERNAAKGNGFGMAVPALNGVANTLTVGGSGRERNLIVAKAPAGSGKADLRRVTPRECLRLQGFPESFKLPVSDTQAYKQTGNTVAVPVLKAILRKLVAVLDAALAAQAAAAAPRKVKPAAFKRRTFVDLFAGIGGFHLGMAAAGFNGVFASEWDKRAAAVYEANTGLKPHGDITKIAAKDVPQHTVLCGGFPCQAFSVSGNQRGFADTRGTLFFDVARIAKELQPDGLFLENVRNLAVHDEGRTLATIQRTLDEIGYDSWHNVLNAADHGQPTARERIYIVAFRKDLRVTGDMFSFPPETDQHRAVADCLIPLTARETAELRCGSVRSVDKAKLAAVPQKLATAPSEPVRIGTLGKGGQGYRIYSPQGVGITLSAYGGGAAAKTGAYLIDGVVRKLHPRECANMMGFPKDFIPDERPAQAWKQFGNSVVVGVIEAIAREIDRTLTLVEERDRSEAVAKAAGADHRKREEGRYYTVGDPFDGHPAFVRWAARLPKAARIVEPFAGACHLVRHLRDNGVANPVDGFDIAPAATNLAGMPVSRRDTLADFPRGYDAVVMNPPYLSRSVATQMGVDFPDGSDARDLYEVALEKALAASPMVAAVIPGSFIRSPRFRERLEAVIELPPGLFGDTDHRTCLALFGGSPTRDYELWQGRRLLGTASAVARRMPLAVSRAHWSFNDPQGSIGLRALDDTSGESIAFFAGHAIPPELVTSSSKAVTRISGLPNGADPDVVIAVANELFRAWRRETAGVLICPFKGKRRRLDFGTAKRFLDAALMSLAANDGTYRRAA